MAAGLISRGVFHHAGLMGNFKFITQSVGKVHPKKGLIVNSDVALNLDFFATSREKQRMKLRESL
ncbi:MAG TPA: hypothetical protein VHO46_12540 [Bacteroidales bacterium]|nr:hypothetical protein [Bacteroidales bacterium]